MLRRLPGVFAAGEMLDWEAPTGGYLLQASFATGAAAGRGALKWLETSEPHAHESVFDWRSFVRCVHISLATKIPQRNETDGIRCVPYKTHPERNAQSGN